ncbi:Glycosyl hydrolases family 16 [Rhizobium sp. NFR07]|uniref:glycoside hydrolase family 16 protein n=1 Tax=Rhizobium sp. NFR07 TaxID=1566262 RepID=UPI0008ED1E49|nr:glycoside hydrolase family 16 protein [Rhizobium sp. NFR07]SFA78788.1 Glycosyl hydrolases family 16 [Rhizobium sp. NFR07]
MPVVRLHKSNASYFVMLVLLSWFGNEVPDAHSADIEPDKWQRTFSEEFDALDVSARGPGTRWTAHTPWNGDFGDARFMDPAKDFPFTIKDGVLSIEARKSAGGAWQSGLLSSSDPTGSGFKQKFGYFEVRARLPRGEGVWPAFWLSSRGEAGGVEVDILEHYGHAPQRYTAAFHIWNRKDPSKSTHSHQWVDVPPGSLSTDFHTFGASVDPEFIRYFFDRREVWSVPTPTEFQLPFTILVNLALGAGWPIVNTPNPSIMEVDYIRAWALPEH